MKNCKGCVGLHVADTMIGPSKASAIVKYVANLKYLCFRQSCLPNKTNPDSYMGCVYKVEEKEKRQAEKRRDEERER